MTDGFNESDWFLSDYIEIKNSLPQIDPYSVVLIGGLNTSDSINVTYSWFDDDLGDLQSGTLFSWENSSHIIMDDHSLESFYTKAGETWTVTITPGDGEGFGEPVDTKIYGINVIIGNTPPEIINNEIKIQGYDATNESYIDGVAFGTNLDLVVRYNVTDIDGVQGASSDYTVFLLDGYAFGSEYRWFRNRSSVVTLITALNGETRVPSIYTERGDFWWVEIKPCDMKGDFGTAQNSTEISITNSAPYLISLSWDKPKFYSRDDLSFNYTFADYDQSDVELGIEIEWYLNGTIQTDFYNNVSISSQNMTKGEIWFARIRVWDGNLYSIWYQLPEITIFNTAPTVSDVLITPISPTATQNLVISWVYFDFDNDSEQSVRIRWYKDNDLEKSLNDSVTVDASYLSKNMEWYAYIEVFDGENYSLIVMSPRVWILNSPPTLTDVVLWNDNDLSNTSYSDGSISIYYFNFTDVDNDSANNSASIIQWYRNGVHIELFDGQTSISSSELLKGDYWYVIMSILDSGGTVWSNILTSQTIYIINKAPEIITLNIPELKDNSFIVEDENITIQISIIDPDIGDIDSSYFEWYLNGNYQSQFTNRRVLNQNETSPNQIWTIIITPSDGENNGTFSTQIVFIESRPQIENLTVIEEQDNDGHFIFGNRVTDSLNKEIISVEYEIYLNGTFFVSGISPSTVNLTGHSIIDFQLHDTIYYNTQALIIVIATAITNNNFEITSTRLFNVSIIDAVAPRIKDTRLIRNPEINPENLTFTAEIEEFGSGIANVILYYYFGPVDNEGSGSSQNQEIFTIYQVSMQEIGISGNRIIYSATIDYLANSSDYSVIYWISTQDNNGNTDPLAYDIRQNPQDIENIYFQAEDISDIVIMIAGLVILLIFVGAVVYVRFIRKPEIVGLDKDLVLSGIADIPEEQIYESLDQHTLGLVVSFFDQRHGPIPIIVVPEILKDNFSKLVELSDRSFSGTGFADDFKSEIPSSYDFALAPQLRISVLSFGFALDKAEARGGQENLTFNLLLHKDIFKLVSQFQEDIHKKIHDFSYVNGHRSI